MLAEECALYESPEQKRHGEDAHRRHSVWSVKPRDDPASQCACDIHHRFHRELIDPELAPEATTSRVATDDRSNYPVLRTQPHPDNRTDLEKVCRNHSDCDCAKCQEFVRGK